MASDAEQSRLCMRLGAHLSAIAVMGLFFLVMGASSEASVSKKKSVKSAKSVFSVSAPESSGTKTTPISHPSKGSLVGRDSILDTASIKTAAKDAVRPESLSQKVVQPAVRSGTEEAADSTAKASAGPIAGRSSLAAGSSLKKPVLPGRSLLFRIMIFFASVVVILGTIAFAKKRRAAPRFLTTTRLSVMDKEVQRACRFIEKNFADPTLSAANVCRELVTGEAFLEALMERDLGVTLNDFITHVRINHAKRIISKDPSAESDDVARDSGFESGAAFRAAFKRLTGIGFEAYAPRKRVNG